MVGIRIWNDVIKVVNKVRDELYKRKSKEGGKYTPADAMKEAWKADAVLKAREEYTKFKRDHPEEWDRLNKEYAANKKPRKRKSDK